MEDRGRIVEDKQGREKGIRRNLGTMRWRKNGGRQVRENNVEGRKVEGRI